MGLDISIEINNHQVVYSDDYYDEQNDYFNKHNLSRTFCNLICRRNVVEHDPELDQISGITGVDISAIHEMETYPEEEGLKYLLESADSEEEKNEILEQAEIDKNKLTGNIDKVLLTINNLIDKLTDLDNLPSLLIKTDFDTLYNDEYFSDFDTEKGQGYIGNNFGQDLRNFKRFLEFAQTRGTTTVWFIYG